MIIQQLDIKHNNVRRYYALDLSDVGTTLLLDYEFFRAKTLILKKRSSSYISVSIDDFNNYK